MRAIPIVVGCAADHTKSGGIATTGEVQYLDLGMGSEGASCDDTSVAAIDRHVAALAARVGELGDGRMRQLGE